MIRLLRVLLFFITCSLCADPKDPFSLAVTEAEPDSLIEKMVSAITGDLYLSKEDIIIQGYVPIRLPRHYLSGDGKGPLGNWSFMSHLRALYRAEEAEHNITIQDLNGSTFTFTAPTEKVRERYQKKKKSTRFQLPASSDMTGITNTNSGEISARSNLKNSYIELDSNAKQFTVRCPDHTLRTYSINHDHKYFKRIFKEGVSQKLRYLLLSETLPSGQKILYRYDNQDRVEYICTTNPAGNHTYASASFHYLHKDHSHGPDVDITTSDGRVLRYRFHENKDEIFMLKTITTPHTPEEGILYHPRQERCGQLVSRIIYPNDRFSDIDYYRPRHNDVGGIDVKVKEKGDLRYLRVKTLKSPVGSDNTPQLTHRFFYYPDEHYTEVIESDGAKIRYKYSPQMRLESIQRYDSKNTPINKESFTWTNEGNLLTRTFFEGENHTLLSKQLIYDTKGNVTEEKLQGILTGTSNTETYTTKRHYSEEGRNLLLKEEEPNGKITLYGYLPDTNLLTHKFICHGAVILTRHFYEYNQDRVLVREIMDDGSDPEKSTLTNVYARTIKEITLVAEGPYIDMPQVIQEKYWDGNQEVLLTKTVFTYTTGGLISSKEIFDNTGSFRYQLTSTYDELGRPLQESNPLGQITTYLYDNAGNRILSTHSSQKRTLYMNYDHSNRMISTKEVGCDGLEHLTQFQYDAKHNKTCEIDPFGNQTRFVYDSFGYLIETHYSPSQEGNITVYSTYDGAGREISSTNGKGDTTRRTYNARNQEIKIEHPDGSFETLLYYLDGTLKSHTDQEGNLTSYSYDALGRKLSMTDPRGYVTRYSYEGFNLHSITDPQGSVTTYTYDRAGRKIAEEHQGEKTEYGYDPLGRLSRIQTGDLISLTEYDLEGKILQEIEEDLQGEILFKKSYNYDSAGNQEKISHFIGGKVIQERFTYDSFDRLISHTDGLGHITTITYDESFQNSLGQRVLRKTTTDPLGQKTIETFDTKGRVSTYEIQSPEGNPCFFEKKEYDKGNHLSRHTHIVLDTQKEVITAWEYDSLDRPLTLIEALGTPEQKTTRYTYTPTGLLNQTIKPNGVLLQREYDRCGNLTALHSSDGTLSYTYLYDEVGRTIAAHDLKANTQTTRTYNPQGHLIQEELAHHHTLNYAYDNQGRLTQLILPDCSSVSYTYGALHLNVVERFDLDGRPLYHHRYTSYDLSGHLLSQELILGLGIVNYEIDPLGRSIAVSSPLFKQQITAFDPVGNLTQLQTDSEISDFAYDPLYQMKEEKGKFNNTYQYDSLYNRVKQNDIHDTFNSLNQSTFIHYDQNGNPVRYGTTTYQFDPLDRLIQIETPSQKIIFIYDMWDRRLSKTLYYLNNGAWELVNQLFFLYQGQNEIGAVDPSGKIRELRILGSAPHAERGAAIAIEINAEIYAPLHDLCGNVTCLINSQGQIAESYRYDAFGYHIPSTYEPINPWRFASKRYDEETHLVYFGRRYYEPFFGRWITPDPLGPKEGPNLYAYVYNNPLTEIDLYGLSVYNNMPVNPKPIKTIQISPKPVTTIQVSPKQVVTTPIRVANVSHVKNISVGLLEGIGNSTISTMTGVAKTGQLIAAPGYFVTGQWSQWQRHWATIQHTENYYLNQWHKQTKGFLSLNERASYYGTTSMLGGTTFDAAALVFACGPMALNKGIQALSKISNFTKSETLINRGTSFFGSRRASLEYATFQNIRNEATTINNRIYTGHALDRMQDRGFVPSVIENAIKNGKVSQTKFPGRLQHHDNVNGLRVITANERVITVIPKKFEP